MKIAPLAAAAGLAFAIPAVAQCPLPSLGVSQNQNGVLFDGWTAAIPIGFAFPFAGATYTDMYVSDHGLIALNNGGAPAAPPGLAFVWDPLPSNLGAAPGPMIAPYWSDHTISSGTAVGEIWVASTATSCTVSWIDAETFVNGAPFSISATLFSDGRITFRLDGRVLNEGSTFGALNAIVGMSPNGAPLPAASDLSSNPAVATDAIFQEFVTTAVNVPNPLFDLANTELLFIPTNPGWVVVSSPLPCATKTTYGVGCGALPLTLDSNEPVVGSSWNLTVTNVDAFSPAAAVYLGLQAVNPGVPLAIVGAPGCSQYIDSLLVDFAALNAGGTATINFPVPGSIDVLGFELNNQAVCLTTSNSLGALFSNGLSVEVGF